MPNFDPIQYFKEAGGVFKFGSGVLGKSSIVMGVLMAAVVVAAWRLQSDLAIIGVVLIGAVIALFWLHRVLRFAEKYPDVAVLEGAEWSGYQRFQATAKNYTPQPGDALLISVGEGPENLLPPDSPEPGEAEAKTDG